MLQLILLVLLLRQQYPFCFPLDQLAGLFFTKNEMIFALLSFDQE